MKSLERNLTLRTIALGVMSGMRSMSAPFLMSVRANNAPKGFQGSRLGWLTYPHTRGLFACMAGGELIFDKLPILPNRISPQPLFGRAVLGGSAGAAAFTEAGKPAITGAALGALGGIASSFFFYYLRRGIDQATGLPDPLVALFEDATLAGIGRGILKSYD